MLLGSSASRFILLSCSFLSCAAGGTGVSRNLQPCPLECFCWVVSILVAVFFELWNIYKIDLDFSLQCSSLKGWIGFLAFHFPPGICTFACEKFYEELLGRLDNPRVTHRRRPLHPSRMTFPFKETLFYVPYTLSDRSVSAWGILLGCCLLKDCGLFSFFPAFICWPCTDLQTGPVCR